MENKPDDYLYIEKSSSDSEEDSKISKKKQAKRIGWTAVSPDKTAAEKKVNPALPRSKVDVQINKDQTTKPNIQGISSQSEAPLNGQELETITSELARRRRSEIAREIILSESSRSNSDRDETNAADEFLTLAEVSGDADAAYEAVIRDVLFSSDANEESSQSIGENESTHENISENSDSINSIPQTGEVPKTENIALNFSNSASIAPSTLSRLNGTFELPQVSYHEPVSPPERPSRLQKAVVEAHIDIEPLSQKTNGLRVVATGLSAYLQERRRGQASYEDVRGPIHNKLEKQVANVRGDLYAKEDIVRKTASDKIPVERTGESIIATENYFNPNVDLAKTSREVPSISVSRSVSRSEQNQPFIDSVKPISAEKQALRMSRIELTKISKKIVFEGVPLQKIYDAHLISDRAQRRIVIAYLRGGNIQKALSRELDVRSIAYEALSGVHVHSGQSELNRNQTMPDTPKAKQQLENKNQSSDRKKFYKTDPVKRKIMLTFSQQSAALSFVVLILLILLILFW